VLCFARPALIGLAIAALCIEAGAQTSHFDAAQAFYKDQKYGDALKEFEAARAAGEPAPLALLYVGMCEVQMEHWSQGASALLSFVNAHPTNSRGWYWLGNAQFFEHRFQQAQDSFQRAIGLDTMYADAYRGLGLAQLELKNYDGAYRSWLKAVSLDPKDEKSTYYLGRLFYEADFADQAAYWLRRALELNPDDYEAMTYLGLSAEVLNFQDTALQLYRRAIDVSRSKGKPYSWAYLSLAKLLRRRGDENQALAALEDGSERCPEAHELTDFGAMLAARKQDTEAEKVLRKAIQLDPSVSEAHYRLALLLRSSGRLEEALQEMEQFRKTKDSETRQVKITAVRK
jgi:tetratricopeptide (TPR) repeat protein